MREQLGASGDFAWAYVIAHELGHHVQKQVGTSDEVQRLRAERPEDANALSVRLELQADCYAGVWANSVYRQGDLEDGDVQEAMQASEAVLGRSGQLRQLRRRPALEGSRPHDAEASGRLVTGELRPGPSVL
jgi:predicted metalloprotease